MIRADLNITTKEASEGDIATAQQLQDALIADLLPRGKESLARLGIPVSSYQQLMDQYLQTLDPGERYGMLRRAGSGAMLPIYPLREGFIEVAPPILRLGDNPRLQAKLQQYGKDDPSCRFYLNPDTADVPVVARQLIEESEGSDAFFHYKFADAYDPEADDFTDRLIIYSPQAESERVFDIIQGVKRRLPHAFTNRALPQLVFPLDDGIGYADDPPGGHSYTNNRSQLLEEARIVAGGENLRQRDPVARVDLLRRAIAQTAPKHNVNARNIAFNQQT